MQKIQSIFSYFTQFFTSDDEIKLLKKDIKEYEKKVNRIAMLQ